MSRKHPIIAVTGSSGAGRDTVREELDQLFRRESILAAYVNGSSFHRYSRPDMRDAIAESAKQGCPHLSHFGPEANLFAELEALYQSYGASGSGKRRFYLHETADAERYGYEGLGPGEFTPWEELPRGTDLLVYEGLHGWVTTPEVDLKPHVDLKVGVVPVINLEWIQKIHSDTNFRGYSEEAVVENILRRMHDYVHYVVPQFRKSDVNFQRVPVVDTSDPITAREVPTQNESVIVIRFRRPEDFDVDFPTLLRTLPGSWMSRRNSIVIPGNALGLAISTVLKPIVRILMERTGGRD